MIKDKKAKWISYDTFIYQRSNLENYQFLEPKTVTVRKFELYKYCFFNKQIIIITGFGYFLLTGLLKKCY